MLLEAKLPPILLLSIDVLNEEGTDLRNSISQVAPTVEEIERLQTDEFLDKFLASDVLNKGIRVPLPLSDEIIPIHNTSFDYNMSKSVSYDNDAPIVTGSTNNVSLGFELQNSLTALSTAADILTAVADTVFPRFTTSPRVSFFGSNICIFNGYLTGINRGSNSGSNKEFVRLSIEKAKNDVKTEVKPKATAVAEATEEILQDVSGTSAGVNTTGNSKAIGIGEQSGGASTGRLFDWYTIIEYELLLKSEIPQIYSLNVINNLPYTIHFAKGLDFYGVERINITLQYDNILLPLGLNNHYPYYKNGYAVDLKNGSIYIGLEVDSNAS